MIGRALFFCCGLIAGCTQASNDAPPPQIAIEDVESGYTFLTAETQALQADAFGNPGLLWVDRGKTLFHAETEDAAACASCHQTGLSGVAARYPAIDAATGKLLNLEGRINQCRSSQQTQPEFAYESDELLALTAYIANQSRDMPADVEIAGAASAAFEKGQDYFLTRRGQFNLSCQQCHTENWGKQLRGDIISQGHGNGFPAYRLEWQSLGSLQRRLRDCDTGVRAEPLPFGDETYIALELYLAARSQGLALESPAVRR
ncbi:MAG: sulfur oxidation c-type cytochrome SoxA [Pseudomonadota bacterium]